jgi:hypothetical protein
MYISEKYRGISFIPTSYSDVSVVIAPHRLRRSRTETSQAWIAPNRCAGGIERYYTLTTTVKPFATAGPCRRSIFAVAALLSPYGLKSITKEKP